MSKIIVVGKNKSKKEVKVRDFSIDNLFKKANLKSNKDFLKRHTWKNKDTYVSLYAKNSGRANNENTYDLPPPVDSQLYFGKLILVKHLHEEISDNTIQDLTVEEWNTLYEKLFGGFEDLNGEDSYSEEEEIPEQYKTKEGYSKEDGFIVDDDEEEDEDYIPDDDEEEEYDSNAEDNDEEEELNSDELISDGQSSENNESDNQEDELENDSDDDIDDIGSELSEESYISESD
tara:strand:+ start:3178 stop:3873 length:696 start_codon:yes stop_codon:yes gene_type:complete